MYLRSGHVAMWLRRVRARDPPHRDRQYWNYLHTNEKNFFLQ